jgi:hypothetical protein
MTTVLDQLRQAVRQRDQRFWTKGGSTHNCVALTTGQRIAGLPAWDRAKLGYRIADFHHGSDNWSTCWLMAHAKDLVRLAEIVATSDPSVGFTNEEEAELHAITTRLDAPVEDPEEWPL